MIQHAKHLLIFLIFDSSVLKLSKQVPLVSRRGAQLSARFRPLGPRREAPGGSVSLTPQRLQISLRLCLSASQDGEDLNDALLDFFVKLGQAGGCLVLFFLGLGLLAKHSMSSCQGADPQWKARDGLQRRCAAPCGIVIVNVFSGGRFCRQAFLPWRTSAPTSMGCCRRAMPGARSGAKGPSLGLGAGGWGLGGDQGLRWPSRRGEGKPLGRPRGSRGSLQRESVGAAAEPWEVMRTWPTGPSGAWAKAASSQTRPGPCTATRGGRGTLRGSGSGRIAGRSLRSARERAAPGRSWQFRDKLEKLGFMPLCDFQDYMGRQQEKHWWLAVLVNPRGGGAERLFAETSRFRFSLRLPQSGPGSGGRTSRLGAIEPLRPNPGCECGLPGLLRTPGGPGAWATSGKGRQGGFLSAATFAARVRLL